MLCCALLWLYIDWFFPYPSGLLHWHCGNLTISPVPAKQPWWIWINTSCEFIMNEYITTTKQCTTKPCAYFLGYTVHPIPSGGCNYLSSSNFSVILIMFLHKRTPGVFWHLNYQVSKSSKTIMTLRKCHSCQKILSKPSCQFSKQIWHRYIH